MRASLGIQEQRKKLAYQLDIAVKTIKLIPITEEYTEKVLRPLFISAIHLFLKDKVYNPITDALFTIYLEALEQHNHKPIERDTLALLLITMSASPYANQLSDNFIKVRKNINLSVERLKIQFIIWNKHHENDPRYKAAVITPFIIMKLYDHLKKIHNSIKENNFVASEEFTNFLYSHISHPLIRYSILYYSKRESDRLVESSDSLTLHTPLFYIAAVEYACRYRMIDLLLHPHYKEAIYQPGLFMTFIHFATQQNVIIPVTTRISHMLFNSQYVKYANTTTLTSFLKEVTTADLRELDTLILYLKAILAKIKYEQDNTSGLSLKFISDCYRFSEITHFFCNDKDLFSFLREQWKRLVTQSEPKQIKLFLNNFIKHPSFKDLERATQEAYHDHPKVAHKSQQTTPTMLPIRITLPDRNEEEEVSDDESYHADKRKKKRSCHKESDDVYEFLEQHRDRAAYISNDHNQAKRIKASCQQVLDQYVQLKKYLQVKPSIIIPQNGNAMSQGLFASNPTDKPLQLKGFIPFLGDLRFFDKEHDFDPKIAPHIKTTGNPSTNAVYCVAFNSKHKNVPQAYYVNHGKTKAGNIRIHKATLHIKIGGQLEFKIPGYMLDLKLAPHTTQELTIDYEEQETGPNRAYIPEAAYNRIYTHEELTRPLANNTTEKNVVANYNTGQDFMFARPTPQTAHTESAQSASNLGEIPQTHTPSL